MPFLLKHIPRSHLRKKKSSCFKPLGFNWVSPKLQLLWWRCTHPPTRDRRWYCCIRRSRKSLCIRDAPSFPFDYGALRESGSTFALSPKCIAHVCSSCCGAAVKTEESKSGTRRRVCTRFLRALRMFRIHIYLSTTVISMYLCIRLYVCTYALV